VVFSRSIRIGLLGFIVGSMFLGLFINKGFWIVFGMSSALAAISKKEVQR
jgi:hypothetical protein